MIDLTRIRAAADADEALIAYHCVPYIEEGECLTVELANALAQSIADRRALCDALESPLHANAAALLEEFIHFATQHHCGCNHPACNRCKDDECAKEVIAACEGETE